MAERFTSVSEDELREKCIIKQLLNSVYISINTQVIIQNCALSLARYFGLSADNHLDRQNGCQ